MEGELLDVVARQSIAGIGSTTVAVVGHRHLLPLVWVPPDHLGKENMVAEGRDALPVTVTMECPQQGGGLNTAARAVDHADAVDRKDNMHVEAESIPKNKKRPNRVTATARTV